MLFDVVTKVSNLLSVEKRFEPMLSIFPGMFSSSVQSTPVAVVSHFFHVIQTGIRFNRYLLTLRHLIKARIPTFIIKSNTFIVAITKFFIIVVIESRSRLNLVRDSIANIFNFFQRAIDNFFLALIS